MKVAGVPKPSQTAAAGAPKWRLSQYFGETDVRRRTTRIAGLRNYKLWGKPEVRGWLNLHRGFHFWNTECTSTAHSSALKRTRGKSANYQEERLRLENRKLEWFITQGDDNNENRNFFTSLLETTVCHRKVIFEVTAQNMVADAIGALQNIPICLILLLHFQSKARSFCMTIGLQYHIKCLVSL